MCLIKASNNDNDNHTDSSCRVKVREVQENSSRTPETQKYHPSTKLERREKHESAKGACLPRLMKRGQKHKDEQRMEK